MKNNKIIMYILIAVICILVVIGGITIFISIINNIKNDDDKKKDEVVSVEDSKEKENISNDTNKTKKAVDILSWVGEYKNGDASLDIYADDIDSLRFDFSKGYYNKGCMSDDVTDDKITYDSFGDKIVITKSSTGVTVKAEKGSSDEEENFSGDYQKEYKSRSVINGIYRLDDKDAILMLYEVGKDEVNMTLLEKPHSFSKVISTIKKKDDKNYEYKSSDGEDTVKITVNGNNIELKASSEEEDSFLNSVSGTYTKEK